MTTYRPLLFPLLLLAAALLISRFLFSDVHPYGGIRPEETSAQALERGRAILNGEGIPTETLRSEVRLRADQGVIRQAQMLRGTAEANRLLRDSLPGYYWELKWSAPGRSILTRGGKNGENEAERVAEAVKGDIVLRLDMQGRVLDLRRKLSDSAALPSLSESDARVLAHAFLNRFTPYVTAAEDTSVLQTESRIDQPKRTDFRFVRRLTTPVFGNPQRITIVVAGNAVAAVEHDTAIPERFTKDDEWVPIQTLLLILYVVIGVAMIVVAFRRMRAYEIGFRLAILMGAAGALLMAVQLLLTIRGTNVWEILVPVLLGPLFFGGGLVLVWSVSESMTREAWGEKMAALDLLSRGHLAQSRIGLAVVRGTAIGAAGFALSMILLRLGGMMASAQGTGLVFTAGDEGVIQTFGLDTPWLYIATRSLYGSFYPFAFFLLFLLSLMRRWIPSPKLLVAAAAAVIGLLTTGSASPFFLWWIVESSVAALAVWSFRRYDGLTVLYGIAVFIAAPEIAGLCSSGLPAYVTSGVVSGGIFLLIFAGGMVLQFVGRSDVDAETVAPAFARFISERQRLQQELEIARSVQMSFLPKSNPTGYRLDIASRCAPALEVGGDYYDFIALDPARLAVAVGDVSGKGTQAAFFMTLTKGFLRAIAQTNASPAETLTRANKLFYENVQRGVFISMVYAVFNMEAQRLTVARAGHNPVIMRKSHTTDVQVVSPMGLALGLDAGETFARSIQEITVPFQSGDVFVFYTDGFPEAVNKRMEEFGEERLCATVEHHAAGTAQQIMEGVFTDMHQFVGRAQQHDDMTIVVVKVV